jgi:hypothetical protein
MKKIEISKGNRPASIFSIREHAAIDAMNSQYNYYEVSFFLDSLHQALTAAKTDELCDRDKADFYFFTRLMLTVISSSQLTDILRQEFGDNYNVSIDQSNKKMIVKESLSGKNLEKHLDWISSFVERFEFPINSILDDYYKHFPISAGQSDKAHN